MRKFLTKLFILLLLVLLIPAASAAEIVDSGSCGENVTWTLDEVGTLTVSGSGAMARTTSLAQNAERVKNAVVEEGVTQLNNAVFASFSNLETVSLPSTLVHIGADAFTNCLSLAQITIPQGVTGLGKGAFWRCQSLNSLVIPGSVVDIGAVAFSKCSSLQSLVLPEGVISIGEGAFSECTSLNSATFPDSLTTLGLRAFSGCSSLAEVILGEGLTAISEDAFANCTSLAKVTIPLGVASIEKGAFWHCQSLNSLVIPGSVVNIGTSAFSQCSSLQSLIISEGVTSIGESAFSKCTGLTSVTLPGSLATLGTWSFGECSSLTEIVFGEGLTVIGEYAFANCASLAKLTLPRSVTSLEKGAFCKCSSLVEIVFSDNLASIGEDAFANCTSLAKLTLPRSITNLEKGAFYKCSSLEEIVFSDNLASIGEAAFAHCTSLAKLTLPQSITSINKGAFSKCTKLTTLTFPASVGFIGDDAFCGCTQLKTVYFQGDAPTLSHDCFEFMIGSTIYYPIGNPTWTADIMQHYGGYLTWVAECGHAEIIIENAKEPTCILLGQTGDTVCAICGEILEEGRHLPAKGHSYTEGKCTVCGAEDPDWVEPEKKLETSRLAGAHRFETAFLAADQMKLNLGIEKFDTVVVASGMDFADALSGSYLAAVKNAPILLACQVEKYNNEVKAYIQENLNEGGTVYILGGENAVPASFETGLDGFSVERLAGGNRFETNLLVLETAGVGDKTILVSTGGNFADSLSASAAKLPILLVYGDKLLDSQTSFLEANRDKNLCILGGDGAVSVSLEVQLAGYGTVERLAGANRFETSVMIAEKFFADPESAVLAYAWNFPDGLCGGPLAAAMNAPLILTMEKYETQAATYIQGKDIQTGIILGGESLIPNSSVSTIFGIK